MRLVATVLISICIGFSVYYGIKLCKLASLENEVKYDYAEINEIKYGLFNIELWKDRVYTVIQQKIDEFEFSDESMDFVRKQIETYLYTLHQEYIVSGKLLESLTVNNGKENTVAKALLSMFKGGIEKQIEELNFEARIPELADQLMAELDKRSPQIKQALSKEISEMLVEDSNDILLEQRKVYFEKYDQPDFENTNRHLTERLEILDEDMQRLLRLSLGGLIASLLLLIGFMKVLTFNISMVLLNFISIVFLVMGLMLPMIELDARLNAIDIYLLDTKVHFEEQVLFYQSKSIVEVTKTLMENDAFDLKAVGFLILCFSIILPAAKMLLSLLYLFIQKLRSSKLTKIIIFYMGKWSMADVFVIAIFMAYIGMYGLVNSQIMDAGQMARLNTINYSGLSPGIIYFTAYCLLSILMSGLIHRKLNA